MKKEKNEVVKQQTKKKEWVLVNKSISSFKEDLIGVESYVDSINEAIDKGANIISLSSSYGGGKSSVCKLLNHDGRYEKVSFISLWEVPLSKKRLEKKDSTEEKFIDKPIETIDFYRSFLYQLAADFCDIKEAKYISKLLNKTTGFFSFSLKKKKMEILFFASLVTLGLSLLVKGIKEIKSVKLYEFFVKIGIFLNLDFLRYFFLIAAVVLFAVLIIKGGIVYNSWKAENNRILTIDDVTTAYVELIDKAIEFPGRKHLIIIEDVDRCIIDSKEDVYSFVKSIVKLLHFDCSDSLLKEKLNSVVLILCLDESQFRKDKPQDDMFLKLIEYRVDIGKIHYENLSGLLNEFKEAIDIEEKNELDIILKNRKNNIRLLKRIVNDAVLKYRTLKTRFKETVQIHFKSCVAYSYLKNNYPTEFEDFISDNENVSKKIKNALDLKNSKKVNNIDFLVDVTNDKNKNDTAEKSTVNEFNQELNWFIKNNYFDEDYQFYFYSYPKITSHRNTYQQEFTYFIYGDKEIDINNNLKLSNEYIKEIQFEANRIGLEYPSDLVKDKHVFSIMIDDVNDERLKVLFVNNLYLNSEEKISISIDFIDKLITNEYAKNSLKPYLKHVLETQWKKTNSILNCELLYMFRLKLVVLLKDDIKDYNYLFKGNFDSIRRDEYDQLIDKKVAKYLVNVLKPNYDLEEFVTTSYFESELEKKEFCYQWLKDINKPEKYINFAVSYLNEYGKYDSIIVNSLTSYIEQIKENDGFIKYINHLIINSNKTQLFEIDKYYFNFGLTKESIDHYVKHDILQTPIIYYLNNKKYKELSECKRNLLDYFKRIPVEFEYLNNNLIEFKRFIEECTYNNSFDYLFDGRIIIQNEIENNEEIRNLHLVVLKNKKQVNKIVEHINKRINYDSNEIYYFWSDIISYIPICDIVEHKLPSLLLDLYKPKDEKTFNLIEDLIRKMPSNNYKKKFVIEYQMVTGRFLTQYFNELKNYQDVNDKSKYAEYINNLPTNKITYSIIDSANILYNYNDEIVKILKENSRNMEVMAIYLFRNDSINWIKYLKLVSSDELLFLLEYSDDFRRKLMAEHDFLRKIHDSGNISRIKIEYFVETIKNQKYDREIIERIMLCLDISKIKQLFILLDDVPKEYYYKFVNAIENNSTVKKEIESNEEFFQTVIKCIHFRQVAGFKKRFGKIRTK